MSAPKWTRDRTYHRCEYRTWTLQVWPVGDGRFCWVAGLVWIDGNESETLAVRGVRASCKLAKAAAIAAVDYRGGERLEPDGCEIVSGTCETRPEAQAAAIDAAGRLGET